MQGFVFRLIPPRPDFATTMTPEERSTMQAHVSYWGALMREGKVVAFGPVLDADAPYGISIITASGVDEAEALRNGDPALRSAHGFGSDLTPMAQLVTPSAVFPEPPTG